MKAIHNTPSFVIWFRFVVLYLKDTEKWKQFTTVVLHLLRITRLCCISKILKNESNSQPSWLSSTTNQGCVVSQRYWKMKAIHNLLTSHLLRHFVVLYLKDTEKWKQFTTTYMKSKCFCSLCCISKILKNESNSQLSMW